ncbi:MAG TPA: hypothetical protein VFG91_05575 [Woeseiaceae bacterium]|nr:hypothetical protein [Woeseiaceae bacterium]
MKYRTGAALAVAAILTGSAMLPTTALADEQTAAAAAAPDAAATAATAELQQELEARLQKNAEAMAADAMTAASDLDLPLALEHLSPPTLVLVSEL